MLLFRVALAPSVVLLASVLARRLGPRFGGQLLGAPTTTGPFLVLMCLTSGHRAAAGAALGAVTGQLVVVCFALAYGQFAPRVRPRQALGAALAASGAAAALGIAVDDAWLTAALAGAAIAAGLWTWPESGAEARTPRREGSRELPIRMAVSGAAVTVALAASQTLGPTLGGMLSSLPVLLAVMAPGLHRSTGPRAAVELTHGALTAAAGSTVFLLVLAAALGPFGAPAAFVLAAAGMVLTNGLLRAALAGHGTDGSQQPSPTQRLHITRRTRWRRE
ncbi:hypothetical protein BEK98_15405 [Streptomyces diastatochromogenes]|uniref:Uncharacterized protein n=2 Tax=Streptomyces diastatochromogenes TaxID=42236 RepID=A0A233SIR0_STRDA|nr:hypothetical protein BEK98_15405 [Streptomyces diastatochromogenes]